MSEQERPQGASIGIIGAGPVGSLLALGCHAQGHKVTLYDRAAIKESNFVHSQERTLVLNHATVALLARLGIDLEQCAAAVPITAIKLRAYAQLWGSSLDARHRTKPYFGLAIAQTALQHRLNQALAPVFKCSTQMSAIAYQQPGVITCQAQEGLMHHQLILLADGSNSQLLTQLGIHSRVLSQTTQQAHVGNLSYALGQSQQVAKHTAFEVFDPPTATTTVVVPQQRGATLVVLAPQGFALPSLKWVRARLSGWLEVHSYTHLHTWPLKQTEAQEIIRPRLAVLGNAAKTMHPLAAQGLNLAYRQCATLFDCIDNQPDPGQWALLRRFESIARRHAQHTEWFVASLRQIASNPPFLHGALALSHLPLARNLLVRLGSGGVG